MPVVVNELREVSAVSATNGAHGPALLKTGMLMAWSQGNVGELGDGKTESSIGTAKATGVNCVSSTEYTVVSPAHEAATVDVTATVNKATSLKTTADKYTCS